MTLDLDDLLNEWNCPKGEICARSVRGRDGEELVQLRVDLGVMQMFPDGRPDGDRYHGLPTALDFVEHELRIARSADPDDWRALERELVQLNYRRIALTYLAEKCQEPEPANAVPHLRRAVRDIDLCVRTLRLLEQHGDHNPDRMALLPTMVFNRARLAAQLKTLEGRIDDAIAEAERGAEALEAVLIDAGLDDEARTRDPGVAYLRQVGQRLRREHNVAMTLEERLAHAIENEDFEGAARLRDELRRRAEPDPPPPSA